MVFKKIIFQNTLMARETPPPLMANAILNLLFVFDFCKILEYFPSCDVIDLLDTNQQRPPPHHYRHCHHHHHPHHHNS